MPIVADHHARDPWRPVLEWPDDCKVQWGRSGLVLRDKARGGCYGTAFFEAFPGDGGFIRGEGADLEAAEASARAKLTTYAACPKHVYGRRGYTNGGGTCLKCGRFEAGIFQPIHDLNAWKRPLQDIEVSLVCMGVTVTQAGESAEERRHHRRVHLRFKVAGVPLPDPPPAPVSWDQQMDYGNACQEALIAYVAECARKGLPLPDGRGGSMMERLFSNSGFGGLLNEARRRGLCD